MWQENKFLKIFSLVAFVAFGSVSCWATAESLHLLLPSWPTVMCWIVTIGFFVIASLGTKLIVDSLNQNVFVEKRGLRFIGGIILVLIFWLICSMPTNTHTFFYRTSIGDIVIQDLATTKSYLRKLHDNVKSVDKIKSKCMQLESNVNAKLIDLEAEIDAPGNQGNGHHAKKILEEITQILGCEPISILSSSTNTPRQRESVKQAYRRKVILQLQKKEQQIIDEYKSNQEFVYKPIAEKQIKNIETMEQVVSNMIANGEVDNNIIVQSDLALKQSYTTIKNYSDFIDFSSNADKELYMAPNQVTKTSRMLSVIDVWKDFIAGKHNGRGFVWWIVISVLVDIAAFVFFDIAFKKQSY